MEEELLPYTITGRVVDDSNRDLLAGVEVQMLDARTRTNERGVYTLNVLLDQISRPKISFSKDGYVGQSITPFRRDGRVITNPKQVRLDVIEDSLEEEIPRALLAPEEAYEEIDALIPPDPNQFFVRGVLKTVMNLYGVLIPSAILLLSKFGITSLNNPVGKSCPSNRELRNIIRKKNNYVRQLNRSYRKADQLAKRVTTINSFLQAIQIAANSLLVLPIPQAIPPGIGIPVGITTTFSNTLETLKKQIDDASALSAATLGATILLRAAIGQALKYLSVLDGLVQDCTNEANGVLSQQPPPDLWRYGLPPDLVQYQVGDRVRWVCGRRLGAYVCTTDHTATEDGITGPPCRGDFWDLLYVISYDGVAIPPGLFLQGSQFKDALGRTVGDETTEIVPGPEIRAIQLPGEEPITQEQLSFELQVIRAQTTQDGQPVVREVNGFILDVQDDEKNPVGSLKRRYAVAKNKDGVILLKGDPSLSSSDQILIDELVFFIQQNDLKPN